MRKPTKESTELSISSFVSDYAPMHITNSSHTIHSFDMALSLYIGFLETKGVTPATFSKEQFEQKRIEEWIAWLREERHCSIDTCKARLSALRTFIKYLSTRDAKYLYLQNEAANVTLPKSPKKKVDGLTKEAVKAILASPNSRTKSGIRDLTFLTILYGTAGRMDEVLSIQLKDLHLDEEKPYVVFTGKGDNVRSMYLLPRAVEHAKHYIEVFHSSPTECLDDYLFYSSIKGSGAKLSPSACRKLILKHASRAHEKCPDVPLKLHAHQFRHARATHWLEEGINIVQISRLLGHKQLETTMRYLDISMDQVRVALATLEDEKDKEAKPKWNLNSDSLSSLCGLHQIRPMDGK